MEQTQTIKLKQRKFSQQQFIMALQKLANTSFDPKVAYAVKKIIDKVNQAIKKTQKEYVDTVSKYVDKDESGEFKRLPDHKLDFKTPEAEKEYDAFEEKFGEVEITIDRAPLSVHVLTGIKLNASELDALEDIVDFSDLDKSAEERQKDMEAKVRMISQQA